MMIFAMNKYRILILTLAVSTLALAAEEKPLKIEPSTATEVGRVTPADSAEQKAATLEKIVTVLRQQRDLNAQALQDAQAQLQLAAAELAAVKQQLADANAKHTEAAKPKEPPKPSAGDAKPVSQPEKK
jgi:hypothetical protein